MRFVRSFMAVVRREIIGRAEREKEVTGTKLSARMYGGTGWLDGWPLYDATWHYVRRNGDRFFKSQN